MSGDSSLPTVTIDTITETGLGYHESDDGTQLALGAVPQSWNGMSVCIDSWAPAQGSIAEPRLESQEPTKSMCHRSLDGALAGSGLNLASGVAIFGHAAERTDGGDGVIRTGGYRIEIPGAPQNHPSFARIDSTEERRFGPNHATATSIPGPGLFEASAKTRRGLKIATEAGDWRPPIESTGRSAVLDAVGAIGSGAARQLLIPGYDTEIGIRVAIEQLWRHPPGTDIVLHTPGTQSHYGLKSEIRTAYGSYGLSVEQGRAEAAIPLPSVWCHAYIGKSGDIVDDTDGALDSRLIITRDIGELESVPDDAIIIADWTSRCPDGDRETIQHCRVNRDMPILAISTPFTCLEIPNRPNRYGGMEPLDGFTCVSAPSALRSAIGAGSDVGRSCSGISSDIYDSPRRGRGFEQPVVSDARGYARDRSVTISPVDSGAIGELLDTALEQYERLSENDFDRAANKVYSIGMRIERLPVSITDHDTWVREQIENGTPARYVPDVGKAIIEDLDDYIRSVAEPGAVMPGGTATRVLEQAINQLEDTTPMCERIVSESLAALEAGRRICFAVRTKSHRQMLATALESEPKISEDAIGSRILVAHPDSIRDIPPCAELFVIGPQRPQHAVMYSHPRADSVTVLTYDGGWAVTIERHLTNHLESATDWMADSETTCIEIPSVEQAGEVSWPESAEASLRYQSLRGDFEGDEGDLSEESGHEESERPPISLDEQAQDRLLDIVRCAPTKNGELEDLWGIATGSEVYQYLSSELNEYYTRNEQKLIVPTEEGEQLAAEIRARRAEE